MRFLLHNYINVVLFKQKERYANYNRQRIRTNLFALLGNVVI